MFESAFDVILAVFVAVWAIPASICIVGIVGYALFLLIILTGAVLFPDRNH
jgi:hypothetical protein